MTTPPDSRAPSLLVSYERAGYARAEPAILQPAEPFLDLSGEDIRARIYLTTDTEGREFCLRPDFTIAVSRDYLASKQAGSVAGFSYLGPIFRQTENGPGEILQAGIESFGRKDIAAADAEMLSLAFEAAAQFGVRDPKVTMGDAGLFAAFIGALDLPPVWKRRLTKDFHRKAGLAQDLAQLPANGRGEYAGVLAALAGADPKGARALVTDLLSIAGITTIGGRSVAEIADRFLEQATLGAGATLSAATRALIEKFLTIAGEPDEAAAQLRALSKDAKLDLNAALDLFESRTGFIAARGANVSRLHFATAFSISLDYYTGFEFRLLCAQGETLAAGGRYDNLLSRLGAPAPIPAVGFGLFIDRLANAGDAR